MIKRKLPKTAEKKPVEEERAVGPAQEKPADAPVDAPAEVEATKPETETPPEALEASSELSVAVPAEAAPTEEEGAPAQNETPPAEGVPPTASGPHAEEIPVEPVLAAEPEPVASRHYSFLNARF